MPGTPSAASKGRSGPWGFPEKKSVRLEEAGSAESQWSDRPAAGSSEAGPQAHRAPCSVLALSSHQLEVVFCFDFVLK